jgi:cytidylate kinase
MLIPSVEKRLSSFIDLTQKATKQSEKEAKKKPTITISREFGCCGYPVAEKLQAVLEKKTKEPWALMDKALLMEVAKDHGLLENVLARLGEKSRVVEDIVSTLSSHWLTEKDYYKLLCREILSLAAGGNVIIVGRGASIITQCFENCFHFRLFGSEKFKINYIAKRLSLPPEKAGTLVRDKQQERETFVRDFLNCDPKELSYYHLVFNNDKVLCEDIAEVIASYVLSQ